MKILGLVGMPKSGKGEASKILQADGWTHISMSGVLRDLMVAYTGKKAEELTRAEMFQGGAYFRKRYGVGYLAQKSIERLEGLSKIQQEKVIIDGIRHPGEIQYIEKYKAKHGDIKTRFIGVIADTDKERDYEIRLHRLRENLQLRGEHFENTDTFDWTDYIETDMPPYGLMVEKCLQIVSSAKNGRILINGEGLSKENWYTKVMNNVNDYWPDESDFQARRK